MQVPMEIAYRGIQSSDQIDDMINQRAARLERVCKNIISCRVSLEKTQEANPMYRVRVIVRTPPEHEIVGKRESAERGAHESTLRLLIKAAFDAAEKQLKVLEAKRRHDVKSHPAQEAGALVLRLFRNEGYGFLRSLDGREIYFHKNSVANGDFERLTPGTGVRFEETQGEQGPQATIVQIQDKPGVHVHASG